MARTGSMRDQQLWGRHALRPEKPSIKLTCLTISLKNIALLISFLSISTPALSAPTLIGEWKSDRKLTMAYTSKNVRYEPKLLALLDRLLGRMTITFTTTQLHQHLPDEDKTTAPNQRPLAGFDTNLSYTILYTGKKVIVAVDGEPFSDNQKVTKYNFDGPDVMWIDMGGADTSTPDLAGREYFRRSR